MKKFLIPLALVLSMPVHSQKAERPLLLSDINPSQLFTKQQIHLEIQNIANKQNEDLSLLQREYLVLQKIKALDIQNLSNDDLAYLKKQSEYQSQSFVKHDEGPLPLAIFDIASASKYKLNQYYVSQQAKPYLQLRQTNWQNFKQALTANNELNQVQLQAKLMTMEGLTSSQLSELAKAFLDTRDYQDPLVMKAVSNSNDAELIADLLQKNSSAKALQMMANRLKTFEPKIQAEVLQLVIAENKKLASAALMQYAKLPASVRSDQWLTQKLSDATLGASAAKAIGIIQSQSALEDARDLILNKSSTRVQVANALLALKFANNNFANVELNQLLEQNKIPYQDMQQEVAKWLD